MKRSKFSEEQIAYALRQAESGTAVADVCRQLGVSEATCYVWEKKFAHLGVSELRRMRSLEEENSRLKQVVADLTLDKHMLAEALREMPDADTVTPAGAVVSLDVRGQHPARVSARRIQSDGLVSSRDRARSHGVADAYSRVGVHAPTLRRQPDRYAAATGRLARQPEARPPPVSPRRAAGPHAGQAPKAHGPASRAGANPDGPSAAVERRLYP